MPLWSNTDSDAWAALLQLYGTEVSSIYDFIAGYKNLILAVFVTMTIKLTQFFLRGSGFSTALQLFRLAAFTVLIYIMHIRRSGNCAL